MHNREERAITLHEAGKNGDVSQSVSRQEMDRLMSLRIRTIYCMCYRQLKGDPNYGTNPIPRWDGTNGDTDKFGKRYKPVWPKIANAVLQCGADPVSYIKAQFRGAIPTKPPLPNTFYNEKAVAKWEDYRIVAKRELEAKISSDLNQIKVHVLPLTANLGWAYEQALNYALRNQACGASYLVRYCAATAAGLDVAQQFREQALVQYVFQITDYDELLGDQIPKELRDTALSIHSRLVN